MTTPTPRVALWPLLLSVFLLGSCHKDTPSPDPGPDPAAPSLYYEKQVPLKGYLSTPKDITELADGSLIVAGSVTPTTSYYLDRMMVVKLTAYGDTVWRKRYTYGPADKFTGYGTFHSCVPTADGNVVVSGGSTLTGAGSYQALVLKLDAATGNTLWSLSLPRTSPTSECRVVAVNDGTFLLAQAQPNSPVGYVVQKISAQGKLLATNLIPNIYFPSALRPTADGNFIVASIEFTHAPFPTVLTKISAQGTLLWTTTPKNPSFNQVSCVTQAPGGEYALATSVDFDKPGANLLLRADATGQPLGTATLNAPLNALFNQLSPGPDNTFIMAGEQTEQLTANSWVFHPLIVRVSAAGVILNSIPKPNVRGMVNAFCPTRSGDLVFCSAQNDNIVVRRTHADLTW